MSLGSLCALPPTLVWGRNHFGSAHNHSYHSSWPVPPQIQGGGNVVKVLPRPQRGDPAWRLSPDVTFLPGPNDLESSALTPAHGRGRFPRRPGWSCGDTVRPVAETTLGRPAGSRPQDGRGTSLADGAA